MLIVVIEYARYNSIWMVLVKMHWSQCWSIDVQIYLDDAIIICLNKQEGNLLVFWINVNLERVNI